MVSIVLLSHSPQIVEGLKQLIWEMAPLVPVYATGGTAEGTLGSDFIRIRKSLEDADNQDGTIVFFDLGSSLMTAEMALEDLPDNISEKITIADAPLVEGALEAAVAAAGNSSVSDILKLLEKIKIGKL